MSGIAVVELLDALPVAERYDIGVRLGDLVAKDMIAVRVSADVKMAIVTSRITSSATRRLNPHRICSTTTAFRYA